MNEKEKAKELVDRFIPMLTQYGVSENFAIGDAKQCALICVDELIEQNGELYLMGIGKDFYPKKNSELFKVKEEIKNYE